MSVFIITFCVVSGDCPKLDWIHGVLLGLLAVTLLCFALTTRQLRLERRKNCTKNGTH